MANTRSSKKDLRRIAKKRVRNQGTRTALKTHIKKVRTAAANADVAGTKEALVSASSAIDKALQRGIIHKNQAARRKSRAAKAANHVAESAPKPAKATQLKKAAAKPAAAKKAPAKAAK
jgi:small subunit ribosomal protein S20